MENKSDSEIKLLTVTNELQAEIIGHNSSILYHIQRASSDIKNLLGAFSASDEKGENDEFLVKIPKSKYYEVLQFINRLSSNDNLECISKDIAEEKSKIRYKSDLIKKLK